jgi:hypothetical protein
MAEGKLTVGNVDVLALTDGEGDFPFPLSQLFPMSRPGVDPFRQRYPGFGARHWRTITAVALVQRRTILVDTGIGSKATNPGMVNMLAGGVDGRLMAELQAAGVRPEDGIPCSFICTQTMSVGTLQEGASLRPTFPRARYIVHQADWETFKQPEVRLPFHSTQGTSARWRTWEH